MYFDKFFNTSNQLRLAQCFSKEVESELKIEPLPGKDLTREITFNAQDCSQKKKSFEKKYLYQPVFEIHKVLDDEAIMFTKKARRYAQDCGHYTRKHYAKGCCR